MEYIIRVLHGGNTAVFNTTVMSAVKTSTIENGAETQSRFSRVNIQPMHRKHSAYHITIESGPLLLRGDACDSSESMELD